MRPITEMKVAPRYKSIVILSEMEVMEVVVKETLWTLKTELKFLNGGNYRRQSDWTAPLHFEDSEICRRSPFYSCRSSRCVLMRFVPEQFRSEAIPCRFIPLNEGGQTLDTLYRIGTTKEGLDESVRNWLLSVIRVLESAESEQQSVA